MKPMKNHRLLWKAMINTTPLPVQVRCLWVQVGVLKKTYKGNPCHALVLPGCCAGMVPVPLLVIFAILVIPMVMVVMAVLVTIIGTLVWSLLSSCHSWSGLLSSLCHLVSNNEIKREKNSMYFFCL